MRQALLGGAFAVLLVAAVAEPVSAAVGWLERLSGPGPFKGVQYAFPVACYGWEAPSSTASGAADQQARRQPGDPTFFLDWDCRSADREQMRVVFGLDVASLATNENPLTYAGIGADDKPGVRALLLVPYVSVPLGLAFEAGAGIGFLRLTDRGGEVDFSSTKFLIQPIRLTFKPLALFSDSTRWEFLQFALNGTLIAQKIEDRDFGAVPGTFREPTEMLWQATIRIDVGKFVFKDEPRSRRR